MINDISLNGTPNSGYDITWSYNGHHNEVHVKGASLRDEIVNKLIDAQIDQHKAKVVQREIKYIRTKR